MNKSSTPDSEPPTSSDKQPTESVRARLRIVGQFADVEVGDYDVSRGDTLIIKTALGHHFATVLTEPSDKQLLEFSEDDDNAPQLGEIARRAQPSDLEREATNRKKETEALSWCRQRARDLELPMKFISVQLTHDGHAATYFFTSGQRIDFRALVKELAKRFKTKVEMKQIGVRDAARHTGGVGSCGRQLCCSTWLPKFDPISIRMAKDQNLTLNQQKLSGVCGRLRCCLSYEQSIYKEKLGTLPKLGKKVTTPAGEGRVRDLDVLRQRVRVRLDEGGMMEFGADAVERIIPPPTPPKKKKTASKKKADEKSKAAAEPADKNKPKEKSDSKSKSKGKRSSKSANKTQDAKPTSKPQRKKKPINKNEPEEDKSTD